MSRCIYLSDGFKSIEMEKFYVELFKNFETFFSWDILRHMYMITRELSFF